MPRDKKPAYLKEINGSAKHDPQRVNHSAPVPTLGIGPAPDFFDAVHKTVWDELASLQYPNVCGHADRVAMEIMVQLLTRLRYQSEGLKGVELNQLSSMLGRFGMTPADRQKISIVAPKQQGKFDKYKKRLAERK